MSVDFVSGEGMVDAFELEGLAPLTEKFCSSILILTVYSSLFGSFTYMLLRLVSALEPRTERVILCSLASNYSVGSILSTSILVAPINCGRPSWLPALLLLVRGGGEGSSCGRATYMAVIWFGQLKMIRFEIFTLVFFIKYFSFGF